VCFACEVNESLASAEVVAWICLVVGILVLAAGAVVGGRLMAKTASPDTKSKLDLAESKVAVASEQLNDVRSSIGSATRALESGSNSGPETIAEVSQKADGAAAAAQEAKSAIEQIGGIIGSLPENLRFAGLLVLVGTILISIATIQFGGTSLF